MAASGSGEPGILGSPRRNRRVASKIGSPTLNVLGLSGALTHDPSAALYIDGKLVAAAEEERFVRDKHAKNRMPYEAAKFCLEFAGLKPKDVESAAIPFAPIPFKKGALALCPPLLVRPDRALDALLAGNRRFSVTASASNGACCNWDSTWKRRRSFPSSTISPMPPVPTCARASRETAILGIDGKGEYATTFFGVGENGRIHKIKEFYDPDSLGRPYGAPSEYLGFGDARRRIQGDGHGAYGDPTKYFSRLARFENGELIVNTDYANVIGCAATRKRARATILPAADRLAGPDAPWRHRRRPVHPLRGEHAEAV